jgi:hypothetical protein
MTAAELRNVTLGELAALISQPTTPTEEPSRYIDLKTSGAYRHALDAINAGILPAFRLPGSRKLWVLRADFERWVERDEHRVVPMSTTNTMSTEPTDEIDDVITFNNARRKTRAA